MMQYSVKPLQWQETSKDYFTAESPAGNRFSNCMVYTYEQGRYWAAWDLNLPGYDTQQEVEAVGQLFHEAYIHDFISQHTC